MLEHQDVEHRNLSAAAREYVEQALDEAPGRKPPKKRVDAAVEQIVRAFESVVSPTKPTSAKSRSYNR